eukprot:TRINITY_DN284_c2_g1_i1.p1 TRINITY_DN284_c2_g1~~TRINITY_DN284_c2_g1_i1.p1  ORF type:complete len:228 (+),score=31.30 TRINITY_DN284_c2_g1_i1:70-753(+)
MGVNCTNNGSDRLNSRLKFYSRLFGKEETARRVAERDEITSVCSASSSETVPCCSSSTGSAVSSARVSPRRKREISLKAAAKKLHKLLLALQIVQIVIDDKLDIQVKALCSALFCKDKDETQQILETSVGITNFMLKSSPTASIDGERIAATALSTAIGVVSSCSDIFDVLQCKVHNLKSVVPSRARHLNSLLSSLQHLSWQLSHADKNYIRSCVLHYYEVESQCTY